ncbi:monocarboxylate transporter 9 [Elysia marginata]|uniref:Monocarboxylate transporter 9 n=1 Tax=Elysia marginata TaxID=1093978 RepID=A0AAV4IHS8_9GAST|nr:monocarboxylate transporter 9 [Elysia marginata]
MTSSQPLRAVPDGGYGWVIVFCSFMIHFLGPGMVISLSVMYVAWLEEFGSSRSLTSWTVSLAIAVFLSVGPLVSSLAHRFGNQATVVAGAVLFCVGFCLSFFVTSVTMLIICIGCISGIGCGFTYLPAIASVAVYFDKRRSLALGIATSGTGIGSFVLAPVFHWLILTYGWRGTLLIGGAFQLNLCALGLLMRPLNPVEYEKKVSRRYESAPDLTVSESLLKPKSGGVAEREYPQHFSSLKDTNVQLCNDLHGDYMAYQVKATNGDGCTKHPGAGGSLRHLAAPPTWDSSRAFSSALELNGTPGLHTNGVEKNHLALEVMMSGSLHSLSMIDRNGTALRPDEAASSGSLRTSAPDAARPTGEKPGCLAVFLSVFTNFSLLKRPDFLAFTISNVLTNLSYLMPVLYMVDRATASGISKASSAALVSVYGAGNVIGRLICGFLGDRNIVDRTLLYVIDLALCGLATCLSPLCGGSIALHGLYAFIFGATIGAFTAMVPMVTVDIMGVSLVGQAYGVVLLFSGIPSAFGPPLAGFVFDWTGDFTASFVLHGVFVLLSALVLLPVLVHKRVRK